MPELAPPTEVALSAGVPAASHPAGPEALAARQAELATARAQGRLPRHIAIIMDGNGRWAEARGLPRSAGHQAGAESVRAITRAARHIGVQTLTLYAFSEQNWARPRTEVDALLHLLVQYLGSELAEMRRTDIRLLAVGNLARLPLPVRLGLQSAVAATAQHRSMTLALCLSYGGREELVAAARTLAERVARREILPADIDESMLESALWAAPLGSAPDLIIRTSGEQRLSNFLLWQSAYAELCFTPVAWPDFREPDLHAALLDYSRRQRRYGGLTNAADTGPEGA